MKTINTQVKKLNDESLIDQAAEQWVNITLQHAAYNRNKKKDAEDKEKSSEVNKSKKTSNTGKK